MGWLLAALYLVGAEYTATIFADEVREAWVPPGAHLRVVLIAVAATVFWPAFWADILLGRS